MARKQGRFDEAFARLDRAAREFRSLGEESGVGNVLKLVGTVAAQRGDYAKAVENYEASLAIRERAGDKASMASLLSNLGIIAEYRGDYERSRAFHERALALRTEIGDRWAIGNSTNCLGMVAVLQKRYAEARDWFQKSMLLNREVGDTWMVAICHNNLGNATRGLGDYEAARRHYADSLRAYRDYDDRWALAFLLEDIGMLAALSGDARAALELIGAADASREAIGAPRAPSLEEEIREQMAPAVAALSVHDRLACRERGRSLDLAAAVDRALALCEPAGGAARREPPRRLSVAQRQPRVAARIVGAVEPVAVARRAAERRRADDDADGVAPGPPVAELVAHVGQDPARVRTERELLDERALGQPLLVEARRVDGLLEVHAVVDRVEDDVQRRR